KGPHPAVVFVHGSDAADRHAFTSLPAFFALHGFATVVYDKRGVGRSSGQYWSANFSDLAADALAAIRLLKNRPEINPGQIGFWGLSQGALYIAPLAATQSKDVAFIISISGASMTAADQKIFTDETKLKRAGYSAADLEQMGGLHRQLNEYF